ncbi:S8 family serine peptidase [Virgibacillus sp. C22-A2]|uniref:S8 family serine peptidase n=1 Tax=Virgibacillus tibetensis TaxID=3042313 RepID=A0ABU6KH06_9BACI|nr:S8 family serine peptidase [Virgibacillus sp. C22-A2]
MRRILSLLTIITALIVVPLQSEALERQKDIQSVIIEVEGNPRDHKAYIEIYHPFIDVIATYEQLFNGLALQGTPDRLAKMESLDFIKAIHTVQTYETTVLTTSLTFNKLSERGPNAILPSDFNTTNYTGEGVKVGVIDTGIDYNHPDLIKNYKAGFDLVDLDDDPMETGREDGIPTIHGSHVAGIIAANGDLQGVAPDADIYAYRALGPGGSGTSVQVIAAMEQAVKDGVDVMNLSLGNSVNGPDYPTSVAVDRAVDLGVAVVIANGNNGPNNWTVGSPATATKALSVGASTPPQHIPYLYEATTDKSIPLQVMLGSKPWNLAKTYPIVKGDDPQTSIAGKIALYKRDERIPFYEKAKRAEEVGAAAVVIYNNEEGILQGMIDHPNPVTIPVAAITKQDGEWLYQQLEEGAFYLETAYIETENTIADFSSRGPVTVNWDIKPDVLAPGTSIVSTVPGGYQELQGTSMAAPHVAGAIALVKEAQPEWTNEQIIGSLKTTALRMRTAEGYPDQPIVQGMGEIQPGRAIEAETIIYDPLLAFGKINNNMETKTIEVTLENTTDEAQRYSFDIPKKQKGIQWKMPQSFTLNKKERKTIPIEISITAGQLSEGMHQGWLTLNQYDQTYHLPYLFVNKTADNPKVMGFEFTLKPFSDENYLYQIYITDPARRVEIALYDQDTLLFDRLFLEKDDLHVGMNEGQLDQSELGKPGEYTALITVYLEDGTYESYESVLYIEP